MEKGMFKLCLAAFVLLILSFHSQTRIMEKPKQSGHAPINGIQMYYEIYGNGSVPLVMIHGGGSTIESNFSVLIPMLSENYQIIAVELQAHGRTGDRSAPESFTQDADDVASLLNYLKIPKAHVLGFSNGGSTTMQVAIRHPELVNKIVVISGAYKREGLIPGFFDHMPTATIDMMPQPLKDAYLKVNNDQAGLLNMFNKDKERMVNFKDWPDGDLKSIKAPALILSGDHDVITPEHSYKMSQLIPNAQLAIVPGDHGSFIGEACSSKKTKMPEIVSSLIKEFLHD